MAAGESGRSAAVFHHSAVNQAAFDYGDPVMSEHWRPIGSQEAVSGTLAFGPSPAAIATLLIRLGRTDT
jgi:hypothetical protein